MKISKAGGVIAAANPEMAFPLKHFGSIPAIKRIVLLFKRAGVFPVVILMGAQKNEVRYQLSASGVVFLPVDNDNPPELFHSAKVGFSFLKDKCEKIIFTPVNMPFFSNNTVEKLLEAEGDIVIPSFKKQGGHPVVISSEIIDLILNFTGSGGLRGALAAQNEKCNWIDVDDAGVLLHSERNIAEYDVGQQMFHLTNNLALERDIVFFLARVKLLLLLISHTHSMQKACDLMASSHSKGWNMINLLEKELGFIVVQRKHGGRCGGRTDLTPKGYTLLKAYQKMEEDIIISSRSIFDSFIASVEET